MGIDSHKSLERRARENERSVDNQWIVENEANEFYKKNQSNEEIINNLGLNSMKLDKDLQEQLNRKFEEIQKESDGYANFSMMTSEKDVKQNGETRISSESVRVAENALYDLLAELETSNAVQDDMEEVNSRHR